MSEEKTATGCVGVKIRKSESASHLRKGGGGEGGWIRGGG